jgi:hypothetical protein
LTDHPGFPTEPLEPYFCDAGSGGEFTPVAAKATNIRLPYDINYAVGIIEELENFRLHYTELIMLRCKEDTSN